MTQDSSASSTEVQTLAYIGQTEVVFTNGTYQFVVIREFGLPTGDSVDDRTVLTRVIASRAYRGSFVGVGDEDATIHGPYRVDAITADSFLVVDAANAETLVRGWAEYAAPLPEVSRLEMDREVYPRMRAATSVYQLMPLPSEALETEWRLGIGSATGFHEFVVINRATGVVAVVMATDD